MTQGKDLLIKISKLEANDAIKENNRKASTVEFKTLEEEIESRFADLLAAEAPALYTTESDAPGNADNPGGLTKENSALTIVPS
jgi:hypothetical protein